MKKRNNIKIVNDEIVIDGRDVERAEMIALKRGKCDNRVGHTVRIDADELLTSRP